MSKKIEPSMTWNEAPDTITPEILGKILGKHPITTRKYFMMNSFPKIANDFIADKEAVRLWCQGALTKGNNNSSISLLIMETRKTNELLNKIYNNEISGKGEFNQLKN